MNLINCLKMQMFINQTNYYNCMVHKPIYSMSIEERQQVKEQMFLSGINSKYVLTKDTSEIVFVFYDDRSVKELFYDLEEPYYSYYESDDSYREVNKPEFIWYKSYKKAWLEIKSLLKDGFYIKSKKVRSDY